MGRKLMSVLRVAIAACFAAGAMFLVVAFAMPGDPASGTQVEVAAAPAAPAKPSYLAAVPRTPPSVFAVDTPDVSIADASADAQLKIAPAAKPEAPDPDAFLISASGLNIRAAPTSQSRSMFVLTYGTRVEASDRDGGWVHVTGPDGRQGWAYSKYLARPGELSGPTEGAPADTSLTADLSQE